MFTHTAQGETLSLLPPASAGTITASVVTRTIAGPVVQYGVPGRTSRGMLKVRAGALRFPEPIDRVKLTKEHDRADSRGHLAAIEANDVGIRAALKVADGPEGDAALREAADKTRDGLSFDVIDATIEGDEIVDALVVAIGQVGIPAFDDLRIDSIAASQDPAGGAGATEGNNMSGQTPGNAPVQGTVTTTANAGENPHSTPAPPAVTPAPAASPDPGAGSPQAQTVTASAIPAVPAGVPAPGTGGARTSRAGALNAFCRAVTDALAPGGGGVAAITAALSDVTWSDVGDDISAPAWSGELWSGVAYESEFAPLLGSGPLTNRRGTGWRWVTKPEMQDWTGNKAAVPSADLETEPADYTAAYMAVGHDIDRAFYDFPDGAAFLRGYVEACRESWAMKLDAKAEAYIVGAAVPVTGPDGADPGTDPDPIVETSVLRAVARGRLALKRRRVGRATFVVMADEDYMSLLDLTNDDVPAFLNLFGIDPANFTSSAAVTPGSVLVGAKQAATLRTLSGSPIRVDAQHLANGGIDTAFFGYWAIEEHHTSGIASVGIA